MTTNTPRHIKQHRQAQTPNPAQYCVIGRIISEDRTESGRDYRKLLVAVIPGKQRLRGEVVRVYSQPDCANAEKQLNDLRTEDIVCIEGVTTHRAWHMPHMRIHDDSVITTLMRERGENERP